MYARGPPPHAVIKYIGSKRVLVPHIVSLVRSLPDVRTVVDLFSGTSRVGHALKAAGYRVTANDHTAYAHVLGRCYVAADRARVAGDVEKLIGELMALPPKPGYFTETFAEKSRYLQPFNAARVDAMRDHLASMSLDPDVEAAVLVSLMEAADRVDSTCGLQMAYLKKWSARSFNPIELRVPAMLDGEGDAWRLDAIEAARAGEWDLAYIDPPYNQHRYLGNYHVWESLIRWDKPEVYGKAMKRVDCREYVSEFNRRRRIHDALRALFRAARARYLLVSFNDEGFVTKDEMVAMLEEEGEVEVATHDYKRYVGARIGIYNPAGEKVGKISHVDNQELLFLVRRR